jgi:NAD(P)-dependent dehydrogenase (short-subunit alcohol dehydrogenase family)
MSKLQNKLAVITGGNSGIGLATAKMFIAEGAKVIITGRNQKNIDEALKELGDNAVGILADTANLTHTNNLVKQITEKFGKVDVLFVNAGIAKFASIEQITEEFFDETININLKGAFFTAQKFIPILNDGSSIIFNTTIAFHVGMPNASVYAASKAGLLAYAKVLATEVSARSIRVNSVSPGPIATPIYDKLGFPQEAIEAMGANLSSKTLLKRFGQSDEIAKVVLFLASDDSSYITGIEIIADGGLLLNPTDR